MQVLLKANGGALDGLQVQASPALRIPSMATDESECTSLDLLESTTNSRGRIRMAGGSNAKPASFLHTHDTTVHHHRYIPISFGSTESMMSH
jgi:hypothetical protein